MIKNLGIDVGNSHTKIFTNEKKLSFPSLVKNGYDKFSEVKKIHVVYNGTDYSVGIGDNNINKVKYFSEAYKILVLTGIAKAMNRDEDEGEFNIVISLPVDTFKDEKIREKIITHIKSWGTQEIEVDSLKKVINIVGLDIWCEGAIIISNVKKYRDKKVVIVDIGGYTWDLLEFEKNVRNETRTEKKGIIILKEEVYKAFKDDYNTDLTEKSKDELFEAVKENKTFTIHSKKTALDKYHEFIKTYVNNIFNEIEKTFNINDKKILFIGGGSLELESFLNNYKDFYDFEIIEDSKYLNAKANYDYCLKILSEEA